MSGADIQKRSSKIKVFAQYNPETKKWRIVDAKEEDTTKFIYDMHIKDLEGWLENE